MSKKREMSRDTGGSSSYVSLGRVFEGRVFVGHDCLSIWMSCDHGFTFTKKSAFFSEKKRRNFYNCLLKSLTVNTLMDEKVILSTEMLERWGWQRYDVSCQRKQGEK